MEGTSGGRVDLDIAKGETAALLGPNGITGGAELVRELPQTRVLTSRRPSTSRRGPCGTT
jgi:ABC-type hemin transport system ATPase subunit